VSWLLDTHVVLWWLLDDPTLSSDIKEHIDEEPDVYVSAATIWEVAVKQAAGKLPGPTSLPERILENGFVLLQIGAEHSIIAARLPMIHRDPFDRMLVAQAQFEKLTLVTRDENCRKYEVSILQALHRHGQWRMRVQGTVKWWPPQAFANGYLRSPVDMPAGPSG
jgi:PIN domain nuclease of toxin-antitoxin system